MRALAIAATGMSAQEQNLEVIANNVANINTTGFKRSRAEFTDLIYQTERLMGVSIGAATRRCPKALRSASASAPLQFAASTFRARSPTPAISSISRSMGGAGSR